MRTSGFCRKLWRGVLAQLALLLLQRGRVAEDLREELGSARFVRLGRPQPDREDIVSVLAYAWIVGEVPPTALRSCDFVRPGCSPLEVKSGRHPTLHFRCARTTRAA